MSRHLIPHGNFTRGQFANDSRFRDLSFLLSDGVLGGTMPYDVPGEW